jgi:hypothetical protein
VEKDEAISKHIRIVVLIVEYLYCKAHYLYCIREAVFLNFYFKK